MLNDPPPEKRRVHPLEQPSGLTEPTGRRVVEDDEDDAAPDGTGVLRQGQVLLIIPSVRPLVTYTILAINIAIFIVRALSPAVDQMLFLWGANHQPDVLLGGELHRLFTSMFLHASVYNRLGGFALENSLHLIFNAYILWAMGSSLERMVGHVRFAIIYLLGGLCGSVMSAVLGAPNIYSVGASGAVFAVLGAQFVFLYRHRKLFGARGRAQMQSVITLVIFNLLLGALTGISTGPIRVDNWAHLGGAIGGIVLTWFIGPIYIVGRHPERPNALLAEDINPLRGRWWAVSAVASVLIVSLVVARGFIYG